MVVRGLRFQPPSFPERLVHRPRLHEQLALRWDRRLTTVIAGPGFGKSALLAESHRTTTDDAHHDAWLTCEPRDAGADHLLAGAAVATGLAADATLPELVDAVWARAPRHVCLVLDDAHEIPWHSPGADVLSSLLVELPRNGHLALASRDAVPLHTARLAAAGQLVRIGEEDLLLRDDELAALAEARGVDVAVLARSGGWPALAELLASAGEDLVPEYLWEEVLDRLGTTRAALLARFGLVGGGGDDVVAELADPPMTALELVRSVPLVSRTPDGWVELHALWTPALRRLVDDDQRLDDLRRVGALHRRRGRAGLAVDLLAEAGAWAEVLDLIRAEGMRPDAARDPGRFERWASILPPELRDRPEAQLARALGSAKRPDRSALAAFEAARSGFRRRGDLDAELATIEHEGLLRWWTADIAGLFELHERLLELADGGSSRAAQLTAVGDAAIAHLGADSATVLARLAEVEISTDSGWSVPVRWLRSVAHRRDGNLELARAELVGLSDDPQAEIARLRIDWLEGEIDHVPDRLDQLARQYEARDDLYLCRETLLELACRTAWLGDAARAQALLDRAAELAPDLDNPLSEVLRAIALAAAAVAEDDEATAAAVIREHAVPALGRPEAWYWRDRAATALVRVLAPETAGVWRRHPAGPAHRPGLVLAEAVEAARAGDGAALRALRWPSPGIARAHLPHRWLVELAAASLAATGTAPPDDLLARSDPELRPVLRALTGSSSPLVAAGATRLLRRLPALPAKEVEVAVIGPLAVTVGAQASDHPNLRRVRVRELLSYLVAHGRRRREQVTDELWADLDDGGRNLRTTLNYLHAVLEPDRNPGEPTYFVRSEGLWLALERIDRFSTDLWELEDRLDQAGRAERRNAPAAALEAYDRLLPLWRGEPFADSGGAMWTHAAAATVRSSYVRAAQRAAELHLAAHHLAEAEDAARRVLSAEPTSDAGHRLLVQVHLARDDLTAARQAVAAYREVLMDHGLEPDASVVQLVP